MKIVYKNQITVEEVNNIRQNMGYKILHPDQLDLSLKGSAFIVSAYIDTLAVGSIRLIWDGGSVAVIPNILILKEYQNLGIEKEMIKLALSFLEDKLKPGYGIQVDIRVFENANIYDELGFQVSQLEKRGKPMHICLTK